MNRQQAEKRGRQAERIAAWWLRLKGWQIVGQRLRTPAGEVDLVARKGAMLAFVEQLSEVNIEGVEPMTSVTPMRMKKRADVVNDGGRASDIVANAPETEDNYFLVPKVVE